MNTTITKARLHDPSRVRIDIAPPFTQGCLTDPGAPITTAVQIITVCCEEIIPF